MSCVRVHLCRGPVICPVSEFTSIQSLFAELFSKNISGAFLDKYTWRFYLLYSVSSKDIDRVLDLEQYPYDNIRVYHGYVGKDISNELWQCLATYSHDEEMVRVKQFSEGWSMFEVSHQHRLGDCQSLVHMNLNTTLLLGAAAADQLIM